MSHEQSSFVNALQFFVGLSSLPLFDDNRVKLRRKKRPIHVDIAPSIEGDQVFPTLADMRLSCRDVLVLTQSAVTTLGMKDFHHLPQNRIIV